jgi:hypothetical protein
MPDEVDLRFRSRCQHHPVGLNALVFASPKLALDRPCLIYERAAKTKPSWTTLSISQFDQAALTREDFRRQFATVLPGHGALDAFDDGRNWAAIVLELLSTIVHRNPGAAADVLVIGAFVGVLETYPPADVVDEYCLKVGPARLHVIEKQFERIASVEP